jgi:heat shock protein HslJ
MKRLSILALAALAACASVGDRQIGNGEWRAVDVNGVPVDAGAPVTLRLHNGQASGTAGCNRYSGNFTVSRAQQQIRFGPLATTRMACPGQKMEQEGRFLSIMQAVTGYTFYGDGGLSLVAADGRAIRFRRD